MVNAKKQSSTTRVNVLSTGQSGAIATQNNAAEYWAEIAKKWAVKMDGQINREDYSSKYYAQQSKSAYEDTKTTADTAINEINTLTTDFETLSNEQSAALSMQYTTYSDNLSATQDTALNIITTAQETAQTAITTDQTAAQSAIAADKTSALSDISAAKTNFDTNAATLLADYNINATEKLTAYNDNDTAKTETYNTNAAEKLAALEEISTTKTSEYTTLANTKTTEYTTLADAKESSLTALSESKETELNTLADTLQSEITATGTSAMHYKGAVATVDELPTSAETGDVYNVTDTGANYAWDGTSWDELSGVVDLSAYLTSETAADTYATKIELATKQDAGDYATNTALTEGLATKQDAGNYVAKTDTSATVIGTAKTTQSIQGNQLYLPNGAIFGGTAKDAGLVTRGICGVITPKDGGGCEKEHLYINYDGGSSYDRRLVLAAPNIGTKIGDTTNGYTYCAVRGDDMVQYVTAAKTALRSEISAKADTATTLAGYGITDAYTKTEVDNLLGDISTALDTINGESV